MSFRLIASIMLGIAVVSVATSAIAKQPAAPATQAAPTGLMKFTRLAIRDPAINNIEGCSLLIPEGWKADGGFKWFPNYSVLANLQLTITDPQTGAAIQYLPLQNFISLNQPVVPMQPGTNYMGNIVYQPLDIPQFISTMYAPQALPRLQRAKFITRQDLPKIAQQVVQAYGGQSQAKSSRVRYEYIVNGKPWEEDIYMTIVYTPTQVGTFWSNVFACSFRAPKGKLDELTPLMMASTLSYRLTPDWFGGYMYVQKLFQQRMQQGIQDAKAISDTITKNSDEIRKMFADSYKQQSQAEDETNKNFSEYVRGVDEYTDPVAGHPVELPSGYNDAWVNSQGEYLLSNTAGYDPNVGATTTWQRMSHPSTNQQ